MKMENIVLEKEIWKEDGFDEWMKESRIPGEVIVEIASEIQSVLFEDDDIALHSNLTLCPRNNACLARNIFWSVKNLHNITLG